jgi:hypothetical protein
VQNGFSAAISFWFCVDSMLLADSLKLQIMLAPDDLAVVIDEFSRRGVHDHGPLPISRQGSYRPPGYVSDIQHSHVHQHHECEECGTPQRPTYP